MKVVVTGASGFVGRAVMRRLEAMGLTATAVVRRAVTVPGATFHCRVEDLTDRAGLRKAFEDADAIVHLAARAHVMNERDPDPVAAYRRVNVDGARAVRDIAIEMGVGRLVYLSTVKVHGEGGAGPYHAADPPAPVDAYGRSKRDAEVLVAESDLSQLAWTIIRAPLIYGPHVGGNFRRLLFLSTLAARIPLPLAGLNNRRSFVYIDNLADAIGATLTSRASVGGTYLISDGEDLSTPELVQRLAKAMGLRARMLPFPRRLADACARLVGREAEFLRLTESLTVDSVPFRRELGWSVPHSVTEGLEATAAWWSTGGGSGLP